MSQFLFINLFYICILLVLFLTNTVVQARECGGIVGNGEKLSEFPNVLMEKVCRIYLWVDREARVFVLVVY